MQIRPLQFIKNSSILTTIYIVLYMCIFFSGSTFLKPYIVNMILITIILLFVMVFIKGIKRNVYFNDVEIGPFLLLMVFAIFLNIQVKYSYSPSLTLIYANRYLIFSFLILFLPKLELYANIIKLSKYYSFVVAFSIIFMTFLYGNKTGGLVGNYQYAGMIMSIACILFLIDYFSNNTIKFNLIGLLVCLCALLMSGKRMFAMLVVISFLVIFIKSESKTKIRRLFGSMFVIFIAIIAMYYLFPSSKELFDRIVERIGDAQSLTSGRNILWEKAIDIFKINKAYGIGFSSFPTYFGDHYAIPGIGAYLTHNIYVGLLAETGIIGFTIYIVFILTTLFITLRLSKAVIKTEASLVKYVFTYSLLLQIWFIIYGFTGNGIYDADVQFFYLTAITMALSVKNHLIRSGELKRRRLRIRI